MAQQDEVIGGYTLVRPLGSGGMGAVWEATDPAGRAVALKLLHPAIASDPDARARLTREVANLNRLRGARLSRVLDAELEADRPFVVTELVEGIALEESVAQEGAFDPVDLYPLAVGLAEAVEQVHHAGLLHRDIKPGNVMVTYDGPVLIDFGIAQLATDTRLTHTGFVTGTPGYLDPAALGGGELGVEGDWYSYAAVLLFAATGRAPFGRERMDLVLARMASGNPDVAGLPGQVATAFAAALAPNPQERLPRRELLDVLRRWAEGASVDGPMPALGLTPAATAPPPTSPPLPARPPIAAPPAPASPPPPSFPPGSGPALPAPNAALAPDQHAPVAPQHTPGFDQVVVGPGAGQLAQAPGDQVPAWLRPPAPRSALVFWSGAVVSAVGALWPGIAVVVVVIGFVLLTAAGLTERRTRRRRLAAGRRRSDPWVATAWSLPTLALALVTAAVPLLVGAVVAVCVWWIGSNLVLTDIVASIPDQFAGLVLPAAIASGLTAAWWVPLATATRSGARACWALLAPTHRSGVIWGWCLGVAAFGVVLIAAAALAGQSVAGSPVPDVSWWPLPAPPSFWG